MCVSISVADKTMAGDTDKNALFVNQQISLSMSSQEAN